jgi:hypothetical protein
VRRFLLGFHYLARWDGMGGFAPSDYYYASWVLAFCVLGEMGWDGVRDRVSECLCFTALRLGSRMRGEGLHFEGLIKLIIRVENRACSMGGLDQSVSFGMRKSRTSVFHINAKKLES